jgi:hypothetical protein
LLLKDIAAPIFDDIRMRITPNLTEQLNFLPKYEFTLLIIQPYLLNAFDIPLFIPNFIDYAIPSADDLSQPEALPQLSLPTHELHCFIAHQI